MFNSFRDLFSRTHNVLQYYSVNELNTFILQIVTVVTGANTNVSIVNQIKKSIVIIGQQLKVETYANRDTPTHSNTLTDERTPTVRLATCSAIIQLTRCQ